MKIVIADDHVLFRDGLASLLEARGVDVVAQANNGQQALDLARLHQPDIILMDLKMPVMDGLAATRLISAELGNVKVVVVTASEEDADLFEAVKSGAEGYILKNLESDQFFDLLQGVMNGEPALTPVLARKVLREFARPEQAESEGHAKSFTEREREVLELLVRGITSNRELAEHLYISENTVKYHLRNIMSKLHLQNRAQVIAYAMRHGLVDSGDPSDN